MTPLAIAIQAHENAAGRPMGDDEAMAMVKVLMTVGGLTMPFAFNDQWREIVRQCRIAYAAGVSAGFDRACKEHNVRVISPDTLGGDIDRTSKAIWRK